VSNSNLINWTVDKIGSLIWRIPLVVRFIVITQQESDNKLQNRSYIPFIIFYTTYQMVSGFFLTCMLLVSISSNKCGPRYTICDLLYISYSILMLYSKICHIRVM